MMEENLKILVSEGSNREPLITNQPLGSCADKKNLLPRGREAEECKTSSGI
jgi:hypothetical protein